MQFTAIIVLFLTFIAKTCFAGLSIQTSEQDESLVEATIEILESCYTDRFSTVGIAGPSAGSIIKSISSRKTVIPTTLIHETSVSAPHDPVDCASRYRLQIFVVTLINPNSLVKTLGHVRSLKWWNHMASFLLVDFAKAESGCSNAYEILWEAWKMNLLNSKFVCYHRTRGRLIYTFNPYTSKAPGSWQQENTYKGINDHPWTLFVREYDKDEPRCDELDFDKTVDLGGYEINAIVVGMEFWWYENPAEYHVVNFRVDNVTAQLLMDSLNATWRLWKFPIRHNERFALPQEYAYDSFKKAHEISDISLNFRSISDWKPCRPTYPVNHMDSAVITQYRGHRSQLDKLISVLDISSRFGVLGVLVITLLFFKFCLQEPLIPAIMNLVLLVCNAGLRNIPQATAPRIYLAGLFIFVVTIQGIYSGILASLLTKNVRLPTVDSLEDLARSDHKIYVPEPWFSIFNQTAFEGRDVQIISPYQLNRILNDAGSALFSPKLRIINIAEERNMHVSREPITTDYGAYAIRKDWPLEDRVNTIYGRLAASGIQDILEYAGEVRDIIRNLESYERQEREPELKPLTMKHLGFAFKILAIGLGFATMIFIVEVATKNWE